MDPDLLLLAGVVLGALALPALAGGYVRGRLSRGGVVLLLAAGALAGLGAWLAPGGYTLAELPEAMIRAIARLLY